MSQLPSAGAREGPEGHRRDRTAELPTRFHIGLPRGGSSFLFNLLRSHPGVTLNPVQDINYYTLNFDRGLDWYLDGFAGDGVRIDTSPTYFRMFDVAGPRIKQTLGAREPRFLLVLRNPIDYARSHWQMSVRQGTFEREPDVYPEIPARFLDFARRYGDWLCRARYAELLERHCFSQFDRSCFRIVLFEDLVSRTDEVAAEILEFFELPRRPLSTPALSQNRTLRHPVFHRLRRGLNRGPAGLKRFVKRHRVFSEIYLRLMVQKSAPQLPPADRAALAELFADDVARLRMLLGRDLSEWQDFAPR